VKHLTTAAVRASALIGLALCLAGCASRVSAAGQLDRVRANGFVTCGILPVVAGFATLDAKGMHGMDVDICRAVAAAIFGDAGKVKYIEARNVGQMRKSLDIDLVARRITWSLTRATGNGLMFGPITFYDGQGFMVAREDGISDPRALAEKPVCVHAQEAHVVTLTSFFEANKLAVKPVPVEDNAEAVKALQSGTCVAYSADVSMLGAARILISDGVETYAILPEMISKEPLAPLVRQGDDQFYEIVRWSIFAMIAAEEYGITSKNIDAARERDDFEIRQFLGLVPGNGAALGLGEDWAANIIKIVGNYGEMFDRNVGADSPIKLERGLNRLWTDGGLMYAPRLR